MLLSVKVEVVVIGYRVMKVCTDVQVRSVASVTCGLVEDFGSSKHEMKEFEVIVGFSEY
jgi:hypothetical protein